MAIYSCSSSDSCRCRELISNTWVLDKSQRYIFRSKIEINTLTMTHTCILQMQAWMSMTPMYTHTHTYVDTHSVSYSALLSHTRFLTQVLFSEVVYSNNLCPHLFFFPEWLVSVAYCWCCFRLKTKHRKEFVSLVLSVTQADLTRQVSLTTGNIKPTGEKDIQFLPCSTPAK